MALYSNGGFGRERKDQDAYFFAEVAAARGQSVAQESAGLFTCNLPDAQEAYTSKVARLLRLSTQGDQTSPLARSCLDGDSAAMARLIDLSLEAPTRIHDHRTETRFSIVNLAPTLNQDLHPQWPLQLTGTSLCMAIQVYSLPAVKTLLALGADALAPVYSEKQYDQTDLRSSWTSLHIAVQYHCPDILEVLLKSAPRKRTMACINTNPLSIALCFSSTLERRAMHGAKSNQNLKRTIEIIQSLQPLSITASKGITTAH
ncbi:uncharacterized protein PODANS_5_8100 [Podospora anserina S mat+]|uniref:Podospora anserina S mat+ genomic DNA chromosome 5, supercontig 9 n=1 Tax=Podospora anserina (strain S / ATCC MYA-4624 / DSM 980 / FGSC 10383) TaxID=515849 RepID=B2AKK1_PODAN|nr:uncharacterized protein PODANS_5_8100 [Podospora anserina S mat+]CAP64534.1 unnamed protein product [Podospora anserina S mat+]CDP29929.1 Putative protein of unknown function [Podospora anserina S mat+]